VDLIDSCFFYGGKRDKKSRRVGYLMQVFEFPDGKFQGRFIKAIELKIEGCMGYFEQFEMPFHSYPFDHAQDARYWAHKNVESRIKRWKKTHPEE